MEIKTFDHAVIYNGTFYPANTPIKVADKEKEETPVKKGVKQNDKGTNRKS